LTSLNQFKQLLNEVSGKLTFEKGVVNRVLFSIVETIAVSFDPKSNNNINYDNYNNNKNNNNINNNNDYNNNDNNNFIYPRILRIAQEN